MKKILLLLLVIPVYTFGQQMSCCKSGATDQFAQLASTKKFGAAHLAPLPLNFVPEKGTMIKYVCNDSIKANAFEIKSEKPSDKWLIVFHEWWGLNDYIKRESERYAEKLPDVNVIAIDLYDGFVAETPETAQEMTQSRQNERLRAIIDGAIKHAGKNAKISTIGWCFGGGWALQGSIMAGKQGVACVMFYGMPETDIVKLKYLHAEVLGIFAEKDKWITPEIANTFGVNMNKAKKIITLKSFKADHAFANPSNPNYNKSASQKANKLAMDFLKAKNK